MRISAEKGDEYYLPLSAIATVYLDGLEIRCVAADEDSGWVEVYKKINGNIIKNKDGLVRERLKGKVKIVINGRIIEEDEINRTP